MERDPYGNGEQRVWAEGDPMPGQPIFVAGEPAKVTQPCAIIVSYSRESPDLPSLRFSGDECAMHAEIALVFALAGFLRMTGAAIPR